MVAKIRVLAWNMDGASYAEEQPHDAQTEFSASNPSGTWSYGYSVAGGSRYEFIRFDNNTVPAALQSGICWSKRGYNPSGAPAAWRNTGTATHWQVGPGRVSLHPGPRPEGDYAILRFTVPAGAGGGYNVRGQFFAGDLGTMSGRIVQSPDGAGRFGFDAPHELFPSTNDNPAFHRVLGLSAGDTLDFVVGNNGNFSFGNTPVAVSVDAVGQLEKLRNIADVIVAERADVVLLNEACIWNAWSRGGVNQVQKIAEFCGLPYCHWEMTAVLGLSGSKNVAVISRYPLGPSIRWVVKSGPVETKYALMEMSVVIDRVVHRLMAMRLDAWSPADNAAGHQQVSAWAQTFPAHDVVIVGGDFNAPKEVIPGDNSAANFATPWYADFVRTSELTPALEADPVLIDHIHFRAPNYVVANNGFATAATETSDHVYVIAELSSPADEFVVRFDGLVKLKHFNTGRLLHSLASNYVHPGSSGQQMVVAGFGYDDEDFWTVTGPFGTAGSFPALQPVRHGDTIRLRHDRTQKMLHSQVGFESPTTRQQEVTCSGGAGISDAQDNWTVEVEDGGVWDGSKRVKLIHVATGHPLHSHAEPATLFTGNQQEVTCFPARDDNDWWSVCEIRGAPARHNARFVVQTVPADVTAGQDVTLRMKFYNNGIETWSDSAGFRLKVEPADLWGLPADGIRLGANVASGERAEFSFTVRCTQQGRHSISASMRLPIGSVFGEPSQPTTIAVTGDSEDGRCPGLRGEITGLDEQILELRDQLNGDRRHDASIKREIGNLEQRRALLVSQALQLGCTL